MCGDTTVRPHTFSLRNLVVACPTHALSVNAALRSHIESFVHHEGIGIAAV